MEVTGGWLVEISTVSEGAVTRFLKRKVISGATERSSSRVTVTDDLSKRSGICRGLDGECEVSEAKCGAFGESEGCLIASGRSGECLGTAGGREGCTGSPGGDHGGCAGSTGGAASL